VIVAVAFVPGPPVLLPEVAVGAAGELDDVRAACAQALRVVTSAELVVVLGAADADGRWPGGSAGSLRGFGIDVRAGGTGDPVLTAPLTVAAWLLDRTDPPGAREYRAVAATAPGARCARLGAELATDPRSTALVVVGEGSARLSVKAPGALDERAEAFESTVADALGTGDRVALAGLDARLAAALLVSGRAPWQVAAAAWTDPRPPVGRLLAHEAPYGVGYLVATWTPPAR
jgi:hypothetical protein